MDRKRRRRRRRRRQGNRRVALKQEDVALVSAPKNKSNVLSISTEDAWDCAPSIAWVIMYFVLVGMVAVSMRFYPKPLLTV
jgi:hypothetical protein